MEIWRLAIWIARCQAFRQAAEPYRLSGRPALARAAWFIANKLLRRGPLTPDPEVPFSRFSR